VLDGSFLPGESAIMVPHTDDGRVLFAVPWYGRVLVGTTDTPVATVSPEPRPLATEIDFLLTHVARYLTRHPSRGDVLSVFAGLRPLLKSDGATETAALARDHAISVSSSGLVTISGGKWTTYRKMAEDTVDRAVLVAGLAARAANTSQLHLHGYCEIPEPDPFGVYGAEAAELRALAAAQPAGSELLHPAFPYQRCQVAWAVRHEYARTVEDLLARRTRVLFLDAAASMELAPLVARLMAAELGRDESWQQRQVADYRALARGYLPDM
jgi:glycerol-3-phosphate dehydrogenase